MKKLLALILSLCLIFALAACSNEKTNSDDTTHSVPSVESTDSSSQEKDDIDSTESENKEQNNTDGKDLMPKYKMAKIDSDSVVSTSKYGISKTNINRNEQDFTNKTFYALSWVLEEADWAEKNYNYYTFKIKDVKTGEFLDPMNRDHYTIHTYRSTIYNTDEFEGTGVRYYGHESKQISAGILYSDYEIKFEDIEIWTEKDGVDCKLEFNTEISEITSAPTRSTGYSFVKFKNDYYVSDAASSGGGSGGSGNWDIYDYISVSNPLSSLNSTEPVLDSSKITFYDKETKQHLKAVPGTELYYEEERESSSIDVSIGVKTEDEELKHSWADKYYVFYDEKILLTQN